MNYISTRGQAAPHAFDEAVLAGLAPDGGLFLPDELPRFSAADMEAMQGLNYPDLAAKIMQPFMQGIIAKDELAQLVKSAYSRFRHAEIAPLTPLGDEQYLLELYHGPTLAFKDFALQFLGPLLDTLLKKRNRRATVIGATSGDTGSAAIAGLAGSSNVDVYILYPHGRVSEVQRRQMTTVAAPNVHCLAVNGTFDDCQHLVKAMFNDRAFNEANNLAAVNSINWARILAQIVYYFYAACRVGSPAKKVSFSVPTGNFGDIYAGYLAKQMGLPVDRLIIASNANDILPRCVHTGRYTMREVVKTLSPSMDIQISSNFERLLFDLHGRDAAAIAELMGQLKETGEFTLSPEVHQALQRDFDALSVDDEATSAVMKRIYAQTGQLIDPHTATGVKAAEQIAGTVITLATAHPAKFPDAVKAATGQHPELPTHLADLFEREERFEVVENSLDAVKSRLSS